jgi:hypothetical protein
LLVFEVTNWPCTRAAAAFDSLQYAHQLEAAGMPREQAEVIAQGLTAMFVHNFDSLVTKDYLDTRFSEQSARIDLLATDVDRKLGLLSATMDRRFAEMDNKLAALSADMDNRLAAFSAEIDGKLGKLYVMFGVIMVGMSIPIMQTLITWLG